MQDSLARHDCFGIETNGRARGVVGRETSRCEWILLALGFRVINRVADHRFRGFAGDGARAEQNHTAIEAGEDGRFKADHGGASFDHRVDPAVEINEDMCGLSGRDMTRAIGAGRGDWLSSGAKNSARRFIRRHANRERGQTGPGQFANGAILARGHNQGERAWPEGLGSLRAASSKSPSPKASERSGTWAISGLKLGRPFAA